LAEVLSSAGYFTTMAGKWHVGQNHGVTPWGSGFERSLNAAAGGFYLPDSDRANLFLNGQAVASRGVTCDSQVVIDLKRRRHQVINFLLEHSVLSISVH
jgi:hypothetical protein